MQETQAVTVLLVDDDQIDTMSVRRAFRQHKIANPIVVARDGIEALEILRGTEDRPPLARPFMILLDLNMPRMNGLEFLEVLRADPDHSGDVVFVLTTSEDDTDIRHAYHGHVAGYIVKGNVGDDFLALVKLLEPYWHVVALPTQ